MITLAFDAIRRRLGALPAPEPPPHLLNRILESRDSGVRVLLPRPRPDYTRWMVIALTAAAALALVMSTSSHQRPQAGRDAAYQDVAAALSFWPRAAMAQQPGPPRTPRYELVHDLNADRSVHAGTWTYDVCTIIDDALTKCRSRLTIEIRESEREHRPAWLMIQRLADVRYWSPRLDTIHVPPDTTYFTRQTLRPIAWSIVGHRIRVERHFDFDSVHETLDITGPDARSWRVSGRLPGAADAPLVLRWARYDVAPLLQALPLARGWRGSVYSVGLIGPAPRGSPFPPLDMKVVGSDRIDVPAGRFDCWRVEMRIGDETAATLWASKDHGWLVKATQGEPEWRTESRLVSATLLTP
jgi:hypothetical protein